MFSVYLADIASYSFEQDCEVSYYWAENMIF